MNEVYVALGTNIGEKELNIRQALQFLTEKIDIYQVSGFYLTEAENMVSGHDQVFLNAALRGYSSLIAEDLMDFLAQTEERMGRKRNEKAGNYSRIIDLDLLFFNEEIINKRALCVPHPRMHERIFVLKPLMDLSPEKIIPGKEKRIVDYYRLIVPEYR